jgi:hypothetical protein
MISLRQHIFSLVAVFVALTIGIAAGTTVVRGPLLDSTRARLESAEELIAIERAENDALAAELGQLDDWASVGPAQLLAGRARGTAVVLVVFPQVDAAVEQGVRDALAASDTALLGEVRIDARVIDPGRAGDLVDAVDRLGADPIPQPSPGAENEVLVAFAGALGVVLADAVAELGSDRVDGEGPVEPVSPADAFLGRFGTLEDDGVVDLVGLSSVVAPAGADTVLVVLSDRAAVVGADRLDAAAAITALADAVSEPTDDRPGGEVLVVEAGRVPLDRTDAAGSSVSEIRGDGRLRDEVSTVDNAETALGWIAAVLAIEVAATGEIVHLGFRDGSEAALPPPVPVNAAS